MIEQQIFSMAAILVVFVISAVYISNKLFDLLNGHLERLQGKLDVLQVQQSETNELLDKLIERMR